MRFLLGLATNIQLKSFFSNILQLKGDLSGKKIGYVIEGFRNTTKGVKDKIDEVVDKMRQDGAIVEEVSIPLHKTGKYIPLHDKG